MFEKGLETSGPGPAATGAVCCGGCDEIKQEDVGWAAGAHAQAVLRRVVAEYIRQPGVVRYYGE